MAPGVAPRHSSRVRLSFISSTVLRRRVICCATLLVATTAHGQAGVLTANDSALVGRILLAEDRRDSASVALREGSRHPDARVRLLARRAGARVRDPRFASRDLLPAPPAPPAYPEPAWRLRFRALAAARTDCAALGRALADSAWPVRLRAADLAEAPCAADTVMVRVLREWVSAPPLNAMRPRGGVSWQPAAHALLALARLVPDSARLIVPRFTVSPIPWLRVYAARAAGTLSDTFSLRRLARDPDDNVKEAAIDALAKTAGHSSDDVYIATLSAPGYQAVRAAARALAGSARGSEVLPAAFAAARRLRADSSETSRDARLALLERIGEFVAPNAGEVAALAADFDCEVARAAAAIAAKRGANGGARCAPMPITLPPDAVALALGRDARLRVTLADSSGGGSFTVHLRGDVAPLMAARVLALARAGYYDGLTWHRVEPDFVIQGGGRGANEFVGHPRFIRDELGTLPHRRGTVGMSTRGHDTGDAQWFVNLRDNLRLNRDYTVFGEVVEGIDVVDGVLEGDVIARIEVLDQRP